MAFLAVPPSLTRRFPAAKKVDTPLATPGCLLPRLNQTTNQTDKHTMSSNATPTNDQMTLITDAIERMREASADDIRRERIALLLASGGLLQYGVWMAAHRWSTLSPTVARHSGPMYQATFWLDNIMDMLRIQAHLRGETTVGEYPEEHRSRVKWLKRYVEALERASPRDGLNMIPESYRTEVHIVLDKHMKRANQWVYNERRAKRRAQERANQMRAQEAQAALAAHLATQRPVSNETARSE